MLVFGRNCPGCCLGIRHHPESRQGVCRQCVDGDVWTAMGGPRWVDGDGRCVKRRDTWLSHLNAAGTG
jgi:hypothetical protein